MDCDDVELMLARDETRTPQFEEHVAGCASCRALATQDEPDRWIARVPEDALDDRDLLVLPTVNPVVFTSERELARGGMGRITRVRDRRLGRDVAIKEVLDPSLRARFEREVAITAQLQHPAIVPVYEAGAWPDGSAFYTMRLVSGGTLADAIAKTTTLEERLALLPHVIAATDALAYAHSRGVIHRDLKPGNILVGEFGETVVIDWGLAKELREAVDVTVDRAMPHGRDLTRAGSVFGTPGFMAPEQAGGLATDERADVYALGAILYHVLGGKLPYAGHGSDEAIELTKTRAPVAIEELAPRAPADLRAIVERAMAREPAARYATAKEMADELRRFQAGQLLQSRAYGTGELVARWVRRHRAVVTASVLALIAIVVIGASAIVNVTRSRTRAEASVTTLLVEQGRAELLAGEPARAATFLAAAYDRGADSPSLRHMLAASTRDLIDAPSFDAGEQIEAVAFAEDGTLITLDNAKIAFSRDGTLARSHPFPMDVPGQGFTMFTPDLRSALVLVENGRQLHDVATGAKRWTLPVPSDATVLLGPTLVALTTRTATALHDLESGAFVATVAGSAYVTSVAFSADGTKVAVCTPSNTLYIYARTGEQLAVRPGCLTELAFLGDRLVVETQCCGLQVWTMTGEISPLAADISSVSAITVHAAANRIVATTHASTLVMWDATTLAKVGEVSSAATSATFSPDGRYVAAGGPGEPLRIWYTDTLQLAHTFRVPTTSRPHESLQIAWSRDSTQVAALRAGETRAAVFRVGGDARVSRLTRLTTMPIADDVIVGDGGLRAIATGELVKPLPGLRGAIAISRDGRRILIAAERASSVFDVDTGKVLSTFALPELRDEQLSADGSTVLVSVRLTLEQTQVRVLDASTGALIRELTTDTSEIELAPAGDRIAVTGRDSLLITETRTGKTLTIPFDRSPLHAEFDPSGTRVFGFGSRSSPRMIDARTGLVIAEFPLPTAALEWAGFRADGQQLLTWGNDRTATLWNAQTGERLATVGGVAFRAMAISPDGARFATATDTGVIQIWDTAGQRPLEALPRDADVEGLTWTRDGTRLVAQGRRHTTVWDVHLETRSPAQIAALSTGWQLSGSLLIPTR